MNKIFKLFFVSFFLFIFSFALVACDFAGGGNKTEGGNVAKIEEAKQGYYFGDDVVVEVLVSSVKVTDPSGKTLEYTLYDDGKIYFLEEDKKVYCTFGENSITNDKGTFVRDKEKEKGYVLVGAKIDSSKQGLYYAEDVIIEIKESSVKVTDPTGKTLEYPLYDDGKIYFMDKGKKYYCTFGDDYVENSKGKFYRTKGMGIIYDEPENDSDEAIESIKRFLEIDEFKLPQDSICKMENIHEEGSQGFYVRVKECSESYNSYKDYFIGLVKKIGFVKQDDKSDTYILPGYYNTRVTGIGIDSETNDIVLAFIVLDIVVPLE